MTIINHLFSELSDNGLVTSQIISMHIKKVLDKSDLKLTKKQISLIVDAVSEKTELTDIDLLLSKDQIKNSTYKDHSEAVKGIESELESNDDTAEKDFENFKDAYLQEYLNKIETTKASFIKKNREDRKSFEQRLNLLWEEPLSLLEVLIHIATETGSNYQKMHPFLPSDEYYLYQALLRLHAKACQTALEILTLLKSGFADGAIARWRLLYEIVIISYFLKKHGNDTAECFLAYSDVTAYQAQTNYQENAIRLGYEPYTEDEMTEGLKKKENFRQKYGCKTKGGYGWAGIALDMPIPNFSHIEKDTDQEHTRPFYKRASSSIHAGSKGLFNQYGILSGADVLLAGPSNYGIADPCRYTADFLTKITSSFVLREESSNVASLIAIQVMVNLTDEIENTAVRIESDFKNERIKT